MKPLPVVMLAVLAVLAVVTNGRSSRGAPAQPPGRLSFYAYSRDSAGGFRDELLDVFRRELGKRLESVGELAYDRKSADVSIQYLGQGELTTELSDGDEPVRYLFRADDKAPRMWAVVRVRTFSKEFSLEGSGSRDMSRLASDIAEWIRQNAAAIRRPPTSKD